MTSARAITESSLDDLRSDDVRFLQEASRAGALHVRLPSDALVERQTGRPPKFPADERLFLARSLRWVESAEVVDDPLAEALAAPAPAPAPASHRHVLVVREEEDDARARAAAISGGLGYQVVTREARAGFPRIEPVSLPDHADTVVVTGCFDWLHSGHIRFFMDAAAFGPLFVVIGSDRNVRLLKGEGHPLQREDERRYMVGSVKPVHRCLISTGSGWMDAEPEIDQLGPTYYVVNEDGDKPEKRKFCAAHGLRYVVLDRVPHEGLPARSSTDLRGF